jgi:hypothetical protein
MGTAPLSMTTRVCSEVPDATFVKAQAASNYRHPAKPCQDHLRMLSKSYNVRRPFPHLQLWQVTPLQELNKPRNNALVDHLLDGRVAFCTPISNGKYLKVTDVMSGQGDGQKVTHTYGQQLSKLGGSLKLDCRILRPDSLDHGRKTLQL